MSRVTAKQQETAVIGVAAGEVVFKEGDAEGEFSVRFLEGGGISFSEFTKRRYTEQLVARTLGQGLIR